jgi:hypothetical protein
LKIQRKYRSIRRWIEWKTLWFWCCSPLCRCHSKSKSK